MNRNKCYPGAGPVTKEDRPGVQMTQIFVLDLESHSGPKV